MISKRWYVSFAPVTFATALLTFEDGCCKNDPGPAPVILCVQDAGQEEPFEADQSEEALALSSPCARACKRLSVLDCPESKRLPGGTSCIETCHKIDPISNYDPECVARAESTAEVRACPQIKCIH